MSVKLIHNVETGEVSEVELTTDDLLRHAKDIADKKVEEVLADDKQETKAALLERLGITADEAKLLLS